MPKAHWPSPFTFRTPNRLWVVGSNGVCAIPSSYCTAAQLFESNFCASLRSGQLLVACSKTGSRIFHAAPWARAQAAATKPKPFEGPTGRGTSAAAPSRSAAGLARRAASRFARRHLRHSPTELPKNPPTPRHFMEESPFGGPLLGSV